MTLSVKRVLENMADTDDPVVDAVFEKQVKTDIAEFDVFMKKLYPTSEGSTANDNGVFLVMYHDDENGHVGTFNYPKKTGYFGGSRIGSWNPWLKPGDPLVKNPFSLLRLSRQNRGESW